MTGGCGGALVAVAVAGIACGCPDGWEVRGDVRPADVDVALEIAESMLPCPAARARWGGTIVFVSDWVACTDDGLPHGGCARTEGGCHVVDVTVPEDGIEPWRVLLMHELAHVAWDLCGVETGHHPDFFWKWVKAGNEELVLRSPPRER